MAFITAPGFKDKFPHEKAEFEKLIPGGNYLDKNDPAIFSKYHDDILYYQTTLSNLTNIVARQKFSSDSLLQLIKTNYHIKD